MPSAPPRPSLAPPTLLLSEIFPPRHGGSGRWFFELYSRLPAEQYLIAAGETPGDAAFDASHNLRVHRLPLSSASWGVRSLSGLRYYWRVFREVRRLVKAHGIKRIHCGRCLPEGVLGWLFWKLYRIPYLCYIHGEDIQTASLSREQALIVGRVLANARRLIANSENTAQLLAEHWGVGADKIRVVHPGMDATRFVPTEPDPAFLGAMGWQDRAVLLTVGRLQRRKGQDMLIQALARVRSRHPNVLYAIVGEGEERARLEALIKEHGLQENVQLLGELDDARMIQCYQQCSLFVLPNRTEGKDIEGFGMVLAEAQACGKPVLAGDSGGTRETMRVGESGEIVDCTRIEPLAEAVIRLLDEGEALQKRGARGREHVCAELDWPVHVKRADAVFGSLGD